MLAFLLATAILGPGDVASMTANADAVIHARVLRRESAWAPGGGVIVTTVFLAPLETWKGSPATEVRVVFPGGEVGEFSQTVSGMAVFRDGEEVVVFLRKRGGGAFSLDRLALGKFSVGAPPGLPKRALRDRRGLDCTGCNVSESDDFSLDELRARVLGSLRK